jgi:hypothetical protein
LICRFFTSRFESCLRTKSCADARFSCASARTSRRFTRQRRALRIPSLDLGLAQWFFRVRTSQQGWQPLDERLWE